MPGATEPECENCGHPAKSHRYGGGNAHGSYTFYSSCRKDGCDCRGYDSGGS